jgi:hypothetical protein
MNAKCCGLVEFIKCLNKYGLEMRLLRGQEDNAASTMSGKLQPPVEACSTATLKHRTATSVNRHLKNLLSRQAQTSNPFNMKSH